MSKDEEKKLDEDILKEIKELREDIKNQNKKILNELATQAVIIFIFVAGLMLAIIGLNSIIGFSLMALAFIWDIAKWEDTRETSQSKKG
jgi:ABC-type proline/glycine betaine transport system permease subunit